MATGSWVSRVSPFDSKLQVYPDANGESIPSPTKLLFNQKKKKKRYWV